MKMYPVRFILIAIGFFIAYLLLQFISPLFFHPSRLQVKGAITYWEQDKGVAELKKHADKMDYISLFWYHIDSDSSIAAYGDAKEDLSIVSFAHEHGIKVLPVVTNLPDISDTSWSSDRVRGVISDEEKRKKHIQEIEKLVVDKHFDGVNIDYEELDNDLKSDFSVFIKELSDEMHKKGKIVGVALHPKTGEDVPSEDNGSRAQDWVALGQSADHLYLMSYGQHWDQSGSGPIASIQWDKKMIEYARMLGVPMKKIFLGISLSGETWNKDQDVSGEGLTFAQVREIEKKYHAKPQWSDQDASPFLRYKKDGDTYEAWFEDGRSIGEKSKLAQQFGLGGLTFWYLGSGDPALWEKVSAK